MNSLIMKPFSFPDPLDEKKVIPAWWLGLSIPHDVEFPSSERIAELWREHVPRGGELRVIHVGPSYRGIKVPRGSRPATRQLFLEALEKEVREVLETT